MMSYRRILRILGIFIMLFSVSMLPPIGVSLYYHDQEIFPFLISFGLVFTIGCTCWGCNYHITQDIKIREGFIVVSLFWIVLSIFAALPLILAHHPHLNVTDAVFEAISGLTTTGASIIDHIDQLPPAILYYRQQLHFLGGMGVVILAIAILPMLSIGGLQLYQAEIPGPKKDVKLTPRIAETAKALWYIYFGLVVLCALFYWAAGMPLFNAIGESYSTVATGGFSMHDQSIAYYQSSLINYIGALFMFLGATNFTLHFAALKSGNIESFLRDEEFRTYVLIIMIGFLATFAILWFYQIYQSPSEAISKGLFNVISLVTTTGLTVGNFQQWPSLIPLLYMVLGIIGGCASSTSGGIKMVRLLLMFRQGMREIRRLIHPRAIIPIKLSGNVVAEPLTQAIWGFIAVFLFLFVTLGLILAGLGMDIESILGSLVACLANVGTGVGEVANGFSQLTPPCKWTLSLAMILGRLEIFTVLVLFISDFWHC